MDNIEKEKQAFLDHIASCAWDDEAPRMVYSDWLLEHDMPEEAERQRKYVQAEKWLRDFAHNHDDFGGEWDSEEEDIEGGYDHSYRRLLYFLERHVDGEHYLPFDTPHMDDSDYTDELWKCFEIVTGLKAPENEDRHTQPSFYCSC